jgi:transitional endoplasmic reticulum ATPase
MESSTLSEVQLRVGDARQRDVGRGIARIDQRTMQKLGISAGDVIEIVNKQRDCMASIQ